MNPNVYHHPHQHHQHHNNGTATTIGPRAKCDQVVYEAIAKAAEIIVRGRCQIINQSQQQSNGEGSPSRIRGTPSASRVGGGGNGGGGGGTSTTSTSGSGGSHGSNSSTSGGRFNLEVEEVEMVRSILQMWKKSLHVPLRLDVYYQYCTDPTQPEQTTRKELLERWCIDYLSSSEPTTTTSSTTGANGGGGGGGKNDDTIVQLRLVCKHIVIFLRTLYSLTRIMPAFRLFHSLQEEEEAYHTTTTTTTTTDNANGPLHHHQGGEQPSRRGGGYYGNTTTTGNHVNYYAPMNHAEKLVGGKILFSFYVSEHGNTTTNNNNNNNNNGTNNPTLPNIAADATLFSANSNSPFARQDLNPIPTPYGLLHLTALYDSSLNVEKVLMERAQRIVQCRTTTTTTTTNYGMMMNGGANGGMDGNTHGGGGGGGGIHSNGTQAIPIHPTPNDNGSTTSSTTHPHSSSYGTQQQQQQHQQQQHQVLPPQQHQHQVSHSHSQSPHQQMMMNVQHTPPTPNAMYPNSAPQQQPFIISDYARGGGGGGGEQNPHQQHLQQQQMQSPQQPSSYQHTHTMGNNHNMNHVSDTYSVRERLASDPGFSSKTIHNNDTTPIRTLGQTKRGPSGLSLALMNTNTNSHDDDESEDHKKQGGGGGGGGLGETPPSPLIPQSMSGDEAASLRQRMAFHHPPPSFGTGTSGTTAAAGVVGTGGSTFVPPSTAVGQQHKYGYGYNNGGKIMTTTTGGGGFGGGIATSPSPVMYSPGTVTTTGELTPQLSSSPGGTAAHMMAAMRSSPIPLLSNTPPQPVFIGSLPTSRRGSGQQQQQQQGGLIGTMNNNTRISPAEVTNNVVGSYGNGGGMTNNTTNNGEGGDNKSGINAAGAGSNDVLSSPPFRNPTSLQQIPSLGSGEDNTVLKSTMVGTHQNNNVAEVGSGVGGVLQADDNGNPHQYGTTTMDKDVLLPPLTSLDMLGNSPFKGPGTANATVNGSVVSSLSMGMGSAAYGFPEDNTNTSTANVLNGFGSLLPNSSRSGLPGSGVGTGDFLIGNGGGTVFESQLHHLNQQESDPFEDMPFAVDMDVPTGSGTFLTGVGGERAGLRESSSGGNPTTSKGMLSKHNSFSVETMGMGSSAGTASSQVVTSLAHRCATGRRLKLFTNDNSNSGGNKDENKNADEKLAFNDNGIRNDNGTKTNNDKGTTTATTSHNMMHESADMSINALASQLADFHSFGNSLVTSGVLGANPTTNQGEGGGSRTMERAPLNNAPFVES